MASYQIIISFMITKLISVHHVYTCTLDPGLAAERSKDVETCDSPRNESTESL